MIPLVHRGEEVFGWIDFLMGSHCPGDLQAGDFGSQVMVSMVCPNRPFVLKIVRFWLLWDENDASGTFRHMWALKRAKIKGA